MGLRAGAKDDAAAAKSSRIKRKGSKRGIFWILGGLVVTGIAAGYRWLKGLPKD
jgi:hypothetical protein